jgi:hypothetical protein
MILWNQRTGECDEVPTAAAYALGRWAVALIAFTLRACAEVIGRSIVSSAPIEHRCGRIKLD